MVGVREEQVFIEPDFARFNGLNVFILRRMYDDSTQLAWIGDDGELVFSPTTPGEVTKPTLRLPIETIKNMMESLSSKGIKLAAESRAEGALEAIKAHLEDMRTIALKK